MTPTMDRAGPVLSRRAALAAGGAGLAGALTGCLATPPQTVVIAGGEPGGFFAEFARLLADAVAASNSGYRLTPRQTTGTLENLQLLQSAEVALGLALADAAAEDHAGMSAIGRMYQTYWQVMVPARSGIDRVADLRGRTISLGPRGSGTRFTALRILAAAGLGPADVKERAVPIADVGRALSSGAVEAAVFAGGLPVPVVAASVGDAVRLVGLAGEVARLQDDYGAVYRRTRIPASVYGTGTETDTLGVASLLLGRDDVPVRLVRTLVEVLVSRPADLVPAETLGTQYLEPRSLISTGGIPLHPAAAEAYRRVHG
jgi:uncharacterized protein